VTPLLHRVGEAWERGELRPGQEHLVSGILTRTLHWLIDSLDGRPGAPRIVLGTPSGQRHELGALIAAVTTAAGGWHPIYLGPDLPGEELASAAERTGARALALSLIHPAGSRPVERELRVLRDRLRAEIPILVGGAAVDSYREVLAEICAFRLGSFDDLRGALRLLSGESAPESRTARDDPSELAGGEAARGRARQEDPAGPSGVSGGGPPSSPRR